LKEKNAGFMLKYKIIVLCFFSCLKLFAQDFEFENISTINGLSQNDVNCIIQDKQGFMWFGTNDGLNRYDGYEFNIYRYDVDGDKGLNSNRIKSLAEDQNHNIWVGTTDGVNILKYLNQSILNLSSVHEKQFPLMDKESVVEIDIIDNLAVVLTKEAIFFFKILEDRYEPIKVDNKYFIKTGSTLTNCYYRVSKNEFIIGTKHGLKWFRLHRDKELKIDITNHEKKINVLSIVTFRKGFLLICRDGVYYIDEHSKFNPVLPGEFNCLLVEEENRLWVGNNFGLHHIVFENDALKKIIKREHYTNQNTNGGLGSNFVTSIYKDKQGVIWLGTIGGGLSKLIKRNNKFKLFRNKQEGTNFKENIINCFFEDSNRNLWLGTDRSGILYFGSGIYDYHVPPKQIYDSKKTMDDILAIHEIVISNKPYVIASTSNHLDIRVYNTNAQPVTNLPLYNALHKTTHPVSIMVSDEKHLWLGTREGGLYRYNYQTDDLQRFLKSENPTLCSNYINTLCIDSKNNLWIGTDKGLNVLLPEEQNKLNPNFKVYTHSKTDPSSISYNNILAILEHENKDIWIGTLGGGLNKYNFNTDSFSRLTVSDGLASNSIKGILADNNNQLWISSNNGLSCLNLSNNQITNFGVSDGLQDFEFRKRAFIKRENGQMLFGGNNGFNSFFPEQIKIDSTMSNLVFTGLNLVRPSNNQDIFYNRAQLSRHIEKSNAIKFKYNENSFTAYFSALDYFAPKEIKYKYRLTGFEESWASMDSNSRFAKYTNLNPGNYILEVLSTNSDGVWLNKPLQLHICIGKAWYKNNIAFAAYVMLLISAFVFSTRYSLIQNNIKSNLLMERFEKEKVKQLSQLKLRFFTNISHELRTPVTIIKSYFENIAPNWKNLPEGKINKDISVITRNINSLNELLNQLLDFTKLEQDKMTIFPVKSDIVKLIESCISSFNIVAINKQIELSFLHESDVLEFWFDEDKMEIIINNMLSNALKYTKDGGSVVVRLNELEQEIKIEIEDTGVGIPESIQSNIFERFYQAGSLKKSMKGSSGIGLSLTKGLIDLHKGRIELISSESNGSNFILFFKKGSSHFKDLDLQHLKPKQNTISIETSHNHIQEVEKNWVSSTEFIEKSVLIVEDNEDIRSFLVEKLKSFFKVDFAENGKIGLEKCIEKSPDVVISDIMMPEMNGYELCDAIKNNETISHIPVILLTAKTNIDSELHGFKLGADAYVAKPFNMDVLIARIESILKSREKIWTKIGENPFFSPSEVTFTAKDEHFLHKITAIIETFMSSPDFSVEQLAEKYEISKTNLNNKIKALTGKTTVQFIRLIRLRRAAELLKTKHNRISDVTYDVGYSDLQHFRQHFKEEFSLSPSAYKKKYS
jgi:signal transduction histidine kinase/ligand-binding sensor domain-containing protein/DNA-binding response OmpR family regulator